MRSCCFAIAIALAGLGLAADPVAEFKPKAFTYETAHAPLSQVLGELAKQTGIAVESHGSIKDRPLAINCKNVPFWEAIEQITKAANGELRPVGASGKLQLLAGDDVSYRSQPMSIDRVFRVWATNVFSALDLYTGDRATKVMIGLGCEPDNVVFLIGECTALRVRDDAGRVLQTVGAPKARIPFAGYFGEFSVGLVDVPRDSKSIALLEGQFAVVAATKMLEFSFARPAASKNDTDVRSETKEGITVRLHTDFKADADLWTARVELEYPADGPKLESFESTSWLRENRATLTNAAIQHWNSDSYELVSQGRTTVLKYRFKNSNGSLGKPEDWMLKVRTPSRLIETDVHFKLENIPLP